jgi:uncharacterized membrane protein (DUF441 family)
MRKRDHALYYAGIAIMVIAQIIVVKSGFVEGRTLSFGKTMLTTGIYITIAGGIIQQVQKYRYKKRSELGSKSSNAMEE